MNINDMVKVRLTPKGKLFARGMGLRPDSQDFAQCSLWQLMAVFGPYLYCGQEALFEGNTIEFVDTNCEEFRKLLESKNALYFCKCELENERTSRRNLLARTNKQLQRLKDKLELKSLERDEALDKLTALRAAVIKMFATLDRANRRPSRFDLWDRLTVALDRLNTELFK